MSQIYVARTSQKLFAAQLQLEALQRTTERDELERKTYQETYREGTLFHLMGAYQALLYEIAAYYGVPLADIGSAAGLVEQAALQGKVIAEANELKELEKDSFSWLSQMKRAYERCWEPPREPAERSSTEPGLIELAQSDEENIQTLVSASQLWLNELKQQVAHVRDTMNEF